MIAALLGCGPPADSGAEGAISLVLFTPAEVSPLVGADALVVRLFDSAGILVGQYSGSPYAGVDVPAIGSFGTFVAEIEAYAGDDVVAAGRSAPFVVAQGSEGAIEVLFLPVNEAVVSSWLLASPRTDAVVALAAEGRITMLGGRDPAGLEPYDDQVWFDSFSGFLGGKARLPRGAWGATSAPFGDDERVIAGGYGRDGIVLDQVVWWSADRATVVAQDPLGYARVGHCLAQLADDETLLAAGGLVDPPDAVEVFRGADATSWRWSTSNVVGMSAGDVAACLGIGGRVLTVGSSAGAWGVFDLDAGGGDVSRSWRALPGDPPGIGGPALLADGDDVLVVGGFDPASGAALDSVWRVFPADVNFVRDVGIERARAWPDLVEIGDDTLIVAGGWSDAARTVPERTIEVRDRASGALRRLIDVDVGGARWVAGPGGSIVGLGGSRSDGAGSGAVFVLPW